MHKRFIHVTKSRYYKLSTVKSIINTVKPVAKPKELLLNIPTKTAKLSSDVSKIKISPPLWLKLYDIYNANSYSDNILHRSNRFFNSTEVTFERSAVDSIEFEKNTETSIEDEYIQSTIKKKNRGRILPEIVFLGSSNAGKSSLLNAMLTNYNKANIESFARTSNKAGYTKHINFFNIGNKFRLVDTPGYGYHSTHTQGELTRKYLLNRKELLRAYILIPAKKLMSNNDVNIIQFLNENGIPYDVIFTKMDELRDFQSLEEDIQDTIFEVSNHRPNIYFTNSITNKTCKHRYGFDKLRISILNIVCPTVIYS